MNLRGMLRRFTDGSVDIRHVKKQHSNFVREALRGQLPMDAKAVKEALYLLSQGKGIVTTEASFSNKGERTIKVKIPVNGYTVYIERPSDLRNNALELKGVTMYKKTY